MGKYVDQEFNEIILKNIKLEISKAFILLEANLKKCPMNDLDEDQKRLIKSLASDMELEIMFFINSQVERLTEKRERSEGY